MTRSYFLKQKVDGNYTPCNVTKESGIYNIQKLEHHESVQRKDILSGRPRAQPKPSRLEGMTQKK